MKFVEGLLKYRVSPGLSAPCWEGHALRTHNTNNCLISAMKGQLSGLTSGKASLNFGDSMLNLWLFAAAIRLYASVVVTEPVVISSESMNERRPVSLQEIRQLGSTRRKRSYSCKNCLLPREWGTHIVATLQAGFHLNKI